jgi:hypothetical protein
MKTCDHGERNFREGKSAKGPWAAWFCALPKGDAFACDPIWEDVKDKSLVDMDDIAKEIQNLHRKLDTILNLLAPKTEFPTMMKAQEEEIAVEDFPFN